MQREQKELIEELARTKIMLNEVEEHGKRSEEWIEGATEEIEAMRGIVMKAEQVYIK